MIQYVVLSYVIIAFILASYEDIKKREVYDYLNFLLAFLVLITAIFHSLLINSLTPLKSVGFGLLCGFVVGSLLYYIGLWGGGDSKFLIGFSAASYYLISFSNSTSIMHQIYEKMMNELSFFLSLFINSFIKIILAIDFITLIFLVFIIILTNKKKEKFQLFFSLVLLFLGLYLDNTDFTLISFAFSAFLIIFFGKEDMLSSIYIIIKKKVSKLKLRDRIDKNIKKSNKTIINFTDACEGLTKEQIELLKKELGPSKEINIRKILPISSLIGINFLCYILLIVTLNQINLEVLSFLFKFLFFSFFIGGLLGILIIIFYAFKFKKHIKIKLNKLEKTSLLILVIITSVLSLFFYFFLDFTQMFFLFFIFPLFFFLKISKQIENKVFVSKKPLSKIVPGDWIVEDIKINKTRIFQKEDFKLGIDEEQIKRLHQLSKKHPHLKTIKVKDGIPFLPPLFIAFLVMILF